MSIVVDPKKPHKYPEPPRKYPDWLEAKFTDPNAPVPESVLEEHRVKVEPWMRRPPTPGKIFGAEPIPAAKYVPPPTFVRHRTKVPVTFKVLNISDRPIYGFDIRAGDEDLITDARGEAKTLVYQGHSLAWSTGRESGWCIPKGAKRRLRMTGMIPMAKIFPVNTPITVFLYPESGEYRLNGQTYTQTILYTRT